MAADRNPDDNTRSFIAITPGTIVGHYRIVEKIGAGGMGEVYLADDTELDRKAALKFLPSHMCQSEDCRARFKREAQAAASLKHPNIVTIYEVSEHQGRPYFAMECCEGQLLRDLIKEQKLPLNKIIDLALQIGEGLQEAHDAGIVHRDIKPSNIILDKKGRPKLADFGLAAIRGTDKLTKTGSTLGTLGYMSPEQIQVDTVDRRSDLFSFGVVLYELITGRMPFAGETEAATMNAVLNDAPEPLTRYKSGTSGELQQIVSKLLAKDPQLRYQTAADIVADLKRMTAGVEADEAKPQKDWWNRVVVTGAVLVLIIVAGYWLFFSGDDTGSRTGRADRQSLVVLPFDNLGSPDDAYFADGITDEITARLAGIGGLRVISRTSAMQYRNTDKSIKEIGRELGVDYILEGTIRWDKSGDTSRVRIIPQLIRVDDDSHIWANTFERAITQVFAVQSDIATQITEALGLTLLEGERQSIASQPTQNLEAYHSYLRGLQYWDERVHVNRAILMFQKAVELDPEFYQAYGMLSRMYGYAYINNIDNSEECYQNAKDAAETAFRLAKGNSDGYLAMGSFYYYCQRDYEKALEQFNKALEGQPNNSELIAFIGFVQRRQGRWDEAVSLLREVCRLDPRSLGTVDALIRTLFYMHRLDEAKRLVDSTLAWAPDNARLHTWKTFLTLMTGGDEAQVRAALDEFDQYAERSSFLYWAEIVDLFLRDFMSALKRRAAPGGSMLGDSAEFYNMKGSLCRFDGQDDNARMYFDSARIVCESRIRAYPDNAFYHVDLAQAYAGLGRKAEASAEAQKAADLLPVSEDALNGAEIMRFQAQAYAMIGEYDTAVELLEYLITNPSMVQIQSLRLNPHCDPLRDHPRFQALLARYEGKYGL